MNGKRGLPWLISKAFSRQYRSTRWMLAFTVGLCFLFGPVEPWVPGKNELHEISGNFKFKKYLAGRSSGVHFIVNGLLLHCLFSGANGGLDGCVSFEGMIDTNRPVTVKWFWVSTRHLIKVRMLDSVTQEGITRISPEITFRQRRINYESDKITHAYFELLLMVILVIFFYTDHRNGGQSPK